MDAPIKLISKEQFDLERIKGRLYDAVRNPQKTFLPSHELKTDQQKQIKHEIKQTSEKQKSIINDEEKTHQIKQ